MCRLLSSIISTPDKPFALLYRPSINPDQVEIFKLDFEQSKSVEISLQKVEEQRKQKLLVIPFNQAIERGYCAVDDDVPIIGLSVTESTKIPLEYLIQELPESSISLSDMHFNLDDDEFGQKVSHLIENEISKGEGSNFVLHRKLQANIDNFDPVKLFSLYRSLLKSEKNAYWVFLINTGDQAFIGASPELHASLEDNEVKMNPISGTYLYPDGGPDETSILKFLTCPKETNELLMVVDEELKMMSHLCEKGGEVSDLKLKQLKYVAHTEYIIRGKTKSNISTILKETMPTPTIIGSPVESACNVVARYEPEGRRYYSGVVALIDSRSGASSLDSAITIRTAEISKSGKVEIGVGSTIVKDSKPEDEANETRRKAQSLYNAMVKSEKIDSVISTNGFFETKINDIVSVRSLLKKRSKDNSEFWSTNPNIRSKEIEHFINKNILVLDCNDNFTSMLKTLLVSLGANVCIERINSNIDFSPYDLVLAGPGPGNPLDDNDSRVIAMRQIINRMIYEKKPFFAVCLSHQILATQLGLSITRLSPTNQGVQKTIYLGGCEEKVGFYNSYCAVANTEIVSAKKIDGITLITDKDNHQLHAIQGKTFSSVQFHLESFLTVNGPQILAHFVLPLFENQYSGANKKCIPA